MSLTFVLSSFLQTDIIGKNISSAKLSVYINMLTEGKDDSVLLFNMDSPQMTCTAICSSRNRGYFSITSFVYFSTHSGFFWPDLMFLTELSRYHLQRSGELCSKCWNGWLNVRGLKSWHALKPEFAIRRFHFFFFKQT